MAHFWSKIRLAEISRLHNSTKSTIHTPDTNRRQAITCLIFVLQKPTPLRSYFSFFLENYSQSNSSRCPLHNYLITYQRNPKPPKAKSPSKKQEDVRPSATASHCEGTVKIPTLDASSPRPRAPTTRPISRMRV